MMTYLYITPFFPSPKSWRGGFCEDAVKALQADGRYNVVVMTATDYGGDYEIDGIKVYQFRRIRIGASEYFESILSGLNDRLFLDKIAAIGIDVADVAVCHVHDYTHYVQYALAIKKLNSNCLTLVHHHFAGHYAMDIGRFGRIPIWSDLLYLKMRREFEAVDAHVFISEYCRQRYGRRVDFDTGKHLGLLRKRTYLCRWGRDMQLHDSYVWYNGVDKTLFTPLPRVKPRCLTIGCVGNFNLSKCQLDLIKAFKLVVREVPEAKLKLIGDGKMYSTCVDYVKRQGLDRNVEFIKPIPHDQLPDFYRGLDLFVMPSVNEGFCCVNAEANYCGTPVIAIKGMPIEEMLSKEDCEKWLVPPHDIDALAAKIIQFAIKPETQHFLIDLDSDVLAKKFVDWTLEKRASLAGKKM